MLPFDPPGWQAPGWPVVACVSRNYPDAEVFTWRRPWATSSSSGFARGESSAFSDIRATASTRSWRASSTPAMARHEELAAFMAGAHAKFTGEPGVCLATSGPGVIHPPPERPVDAVLDHQPGGRHRRPVGHHRAGRRLPAGGRPAEPLQGRRPQPCHHVDHALSRPAQDRSRVPHRHFGEAKAYARSVLKGDPDARHMIGETIKMPSPAS
jgi:hypothetical protein